MSENIFQDSPLRVFVWKDQLPEVHEGTRSPYVVLNVDGGEIKFGRMPNENAAVLYELAAAYLALAGHAAKTEEPAPEPHHFAAYDVGGRKFILDAHDDRATNYLNS